MATAAEAAKQAHKQRMVWYFTLLAMASLIWSAQGTAVKFLNRQMGPIAITFLPFYITTLLFVPLLIRKRRSHPNAGSLGWKDWGRFALAGVGGQVLAQLGMTWGISKSLASNGAVLNLMIPVITAVLASFMLREKLTVLRVAALGMGLVGVLLMSVPDLRESSFLEMKYLGGNGLILVGCFGSSFYNTYCKGLMRRFPGNRNSDLQLHHGVGGKPAAADLGGAVPLQGVCRSRLEIVGRVRVSCHPDVRSFHAAVLCRAGAPGCDCCLRFALPGANFRRATGGGATG